MGSSSVSFHDSYTTRIFVAYMGLDFGCRDECGEPRDVLGWIRLDPGNTQSRVSPTNNRYYYAEALDGATWSGPWRPR